MAGYIRQRGEKSWQLTVYVGYDSKARKRRYASKTIRGTKREAERAIAKKAQLAASTADRYRVAIKLIDPSILKVAVAKLRAHHIEDLYADLLKSGQSDSSIRKVHWALRQSLARAHKRGLTGIIATNGVELPPLGAREISPPSSADVRKVIDYLMSNDPDWGTLVAVVAWTRCRRGEVCGLRWEDVDLKARSVLIRRAVVAVPGGIQEKGTKTGKVRRIAIGPKTVKLLREHQKRCTSRAKVCGEEVESSSYVFSPEAAGGRPYNPHTITRTFVDAYKDAGVGPIRLHDLRHHSATTLLKSGASVGEVMDRHGWHTVEMVNRYRHLLEATDIEAAKALENA